MKAHGHFKTRELAESMASYHREHEEERLENPRVKITRKFTVRKLASGMYSLQSDKVYRAGTSWTNNWAKRKGTK